MQHVNPDGPLTAVQCNGILNVGDRFKCHDSIREIVAVEDRNGRQYIKYSHNGNVVDAWLEASRFSPGWEKL